MKNSRIRRARADDLAAMVALLKSLFALESDFTFAEEKQKRGLELLLSAENALLLVAEVENKVVGMVSGQLTISTAEGGYALLLEDLVIESGCRGRGIGRRLVVELENWARAQGVSRLQLLADCDNLPALDFYQHLGWQETRLICRRRRV